MVGTILTYELVLLQFDKSAHEEAGDEDVEPLKAFCMAGNGQ